MAESKNADAGDDGGGEVATTTMTILGDYPYRQMLHRLQVRAHRAQSNVNDDNNGNGVDERKSSDTAAGWDLSDDSMLATLLYELSSHVASRAAHVASEIRNLQMSVNEVGTEVSLVQTEFMRRTASMFLDQVVVGDNDDPESEAGGGNGEVVDEDEPSGGRSDKGLSDDDDDSSADIARLEEEERSAISDGIKALSLFFDPMRVESGGRDGNGSGSGKGGSSVGPPIMIIDTEEDNCYYYPSAEEDGFNQRPLPFIVGSREFMESSCVGLGDENNVGVRS